MKIYIAGKITGEDRAACKAKFAEAENRIRELGAVPITPFKLGIPEHFTFAESKPFNFKAIAKCHAIFMLADYTSSPGALDELDEAQRLKREIFYEQFEGYEALEDAIRLGIISPGY